MFSTVYQKGENGVEVFSPSGSGDPLKGTFSVTNESSIVKQYNRNIKGYCIQMESESATTKLSCPNSKHYSSLALTQPLLCLQLSLPSFPGKAFSLQLSIYDHNHQRKRFHFSTNFISQSMNSQVDSVLSVKLPWPSHLQCFPDKDEDDNPDLERWITYVLNLQELCSSCFPLSTFSSLDSFILHPSCKLRKIFTLPSSALFPSSDGDGKPIVNIPPTFAFPSSGCCQTTFYYSLSSFSSSSSMTAPAAPSSLLGKDKGKTIVMPLIGGGSDGAMMIAGRHVTVGSCNTHTNTATAGKPSSTLANPAPARSNNKEKVAQSHRDKILASLKKKKLVAAPSSSSDLTTAQKNGEEERNKEKEQKSKEPIIPEKSLNEKAMNDVRRDEEKQEGEKTQVISPRESQTKQIDLSLSKKILRAVNEKISTQKSDDTKDTTFLDETVIKSEMTRPLSSSSSPSLRSSNPLRSSKEQNTLTEELPVPMAVHDYIKAEIDWIYGKKSLSPRSSASFPSTQQQGSLSAPSAALLSDPTPSINSSLPSGLSKNSAVVDKQEDFEPRTNTQTSMRGGFRDTLSDSNNEKEVTEILPPYSPHQPIVSVPPLSSAHNDRPVSQSSANNSLSRPALLPYPPIIDKRIREVKRFYESKVTEKAKNFVISAEEKVRRIHKFELLLCSLKTLEVSFVADYGADEYNQLIGEFVVE
jgi:hypothetical protein